MLYRLPVALGRESTVPRLVDYLKENLAFKFASGEKGHGGERGSLNVEKDCFDPQSK